MKKVGILGGTFDPFHNGHMYLAQTALLKAGLDCVMFLPLNVPPHKGTPVSDSDKRYELIKRCIKHNPRLFVSDMEIKRSGTTYTIDTLKELKQLYPDWDLHYIIGTDTLYELEKWRDIKQVFSMCSFICMSRPGEDCHGQEQYARSLSEKYGGAVCVIQTMGRDVSSTLIKASPASLIPALVPKEIADDVIKIYAKDDIK